ncbi:hypothetical protein WICMUC_002185 [Wickerhamomyces mucosus]|uniref:DNA mismatch repair proteins mutS family domain-containing protein n=1 Tax=Wickerhamomyces mucosus TaxID=1378264 RepID=A0A9P8PQ06_9ASCO|nr:hypothetical protein WICMUC_002185 [Wickerhamomyces mucosus]
MQFYSSLVSDASNNLSINKPDKTILSLSAMSKLKPQVNHQGYQSPIDSEKGQYKDLTPLMKTVRQTMDKYRGYVVLTQVGSFYELYFENATEYAPQLNIRLAKRDFKDRSIAMAGFPLSQLDRYLKVLVHDLNEGVAVIEQFKSKSPIDNDPITVSRRVTRLISPGTLIDEAFLNQQDNNFLLSIEFPSKMFDRSPDLESKIGLSWIDLSVGTLFVQETTLSGLISTVTRIKPSEIILDDSLVKHHLESGQWYSEFAELQKYFRKYQQLPAKRKTMSEYFHMFDFPERTLKKAFDLLTLKETSSLKNLLQYIKDHLPGSEITLELPEKQYSKNIVQIDPRTSDALELHKTYKDQFVKGSLMSTIKKTVTDSGTRLLSQWISSPSTDLWEIKRRQALVTIFHKDPSFRNAVVSKLKEIHDISRIIQRFSLGRGTPLDLVYLAKAIYKVDEIEQLMINKIRCAPECKSALNHLIDSLNSHSELAKEILQDLDEESLMQHLKIEQQEIEDDINPNKHSSEKQSDVDDLFSVQESASPSLQKLHFELRKLIAFKRDLEKDLHTKFVTEGSFKEVELRYTPAYSYQVYFKGGKSADFSSLEDSLPGSKVLQRSSATRWISYPKWSELGQGIDAVKYRIKIEELEVIKVLKIKVMNSCINLRMTAKTIDYIDVTSSFAVLAQERGLVCPEISEGTELEIIKGRHLVVETGLSHSLKNFIPNDCSLDKNNSIWMITGPNMGGKSTFLRQNAIIVILGQIGSYVPAESARIGIVDKIFSRVGSADDLYNQMSTFMVEMVETSYILNGATDRSLAILDEVGRGTSGKEGIAIAYATLKHLESTNNCRVLFATHFGMEIKELLDNHSSSSGILFKKTNIEKLNGKIIFSHHLENGVSENSFAIDVAKFAGFPHKALQIAQNVYNDIK